MHKLRDYMERYNENDEKIMDKEVNFDLYKDVEQMAEDTCNLIKDDAAFCDAEWNLFQEWYNRMGFSEEEWKYVEACGYERDQFIRE